ncbi:MAG: DUF523 and DUF1722 domain-containing protein [Campylobacterales bacterium]|nr:DUF523 and DUF1722 domain-containing protein [Campylobacterales bacterium]
MKIGVSSCLLGNEVRYDGSGSKDQFVVNQLGQFFDFVPYCPESVIFGTPRDTIRLVDENNSIKVYTNKSKEDVTSILDQESFNQANDVQNHDICGFILKSKSPTCGLERVKVYQTKRNLNEKKGVGLFAAQLLKMYPYLPIEEDGRLNDPWLKENFIMQVFAYGDLMNFIKNDPNHKKLVEFHTSYKYLIYAKSQSSYKELGNIVANHDKKDFNTLLDEYKNGFLKGIAIKGTINKTYNVLLHIFGYFKKDITSGEKEVILSSLEEYKNGIIPLIAVIKILNIYVKRFDVEYLKTQKFLNPYPHELALRSDLKAYK